MSEYCIAFNRFGLGARTDDSAPADPRRWLAAQLDRFDPRPAPIAALPSRADLVTELAEYLDQLRGQNAGARPRATAAAMTNAAEARPMNAVAAPMAAPADNPNSPLDQATAGLPDNVRQYVRRAVRQHYFGMVSARTDAALTTPAPFVERMVHFWANHFAVSADKLPVIGLAGLLEFEAVRPHVLGRFSDMLMAVEQHPAMLLYLDQAQSIGPDSNVAQLAERFGRQRRGLNENLAREILELHTLGVHGGYSQADVTEFARALTGWTVSGLARGPARRFINDSGPAGNFVFAEAIHQPGDRNILGRAYRQQGEAQARAVLGDLAAHPATARHIATKLARHFAGDDPPPAMVERLTGAWQQSGGDLPTVYRAILESPEAWAPAPAKFRTPWEWSVAALRAVGARELDGPRAVGLFSQLGQPVWRPGSPAGYDDVAASWNGPDALMRRVEAAERIAGRAGAAVDARALAPRLLGDSLSAATAQAIARAESPSQGLALLLVSPEFLRR